MVAHHYHFEIAMSCGGCSGAIERVIKKLDGVEKSDVSLENQTADIYTTEESSETYGTILSRIHKTGKKINKGSEDGEEKSIEPEEQSVQSVQPEVLATA